MNTIGVNISANKTFTSSAEELLTRKSQFIHSLLTELCTSANYHCEKLKRQSDRQSVVRQYETLCRSVITGYREGIAGTVPPKQTDHVEDCEQRVKYLSAPFRTKGYEIACRQIELLIERGEHRSCSKTGSTAHPDQNQNGTQGGTSTPSP